MNIRVLILDDNVEEAISYFISAIAPFLPKGYQWKRSEKQAMAERPSFQLALNGFDKEISATVCHNPFDYKTADEVLAWVDKLIAEKQADFDLVLLDDNWGGQSADDENYCAGQNILLPAIFPRMKDSTYFSLFTKHWEDKDERIKNFASLFHCQPYAGTHRLTGLSKDNHGGVMVLLNAVIGLKEVMAERDRYKAQLLSQNEVIRTYGVPSIEELRVEPPVPYLIGKSTPMRAVYFKISAEASSRQNVCLYGESGVGKLLVAQAIHDLSPRGKAGKAFIRCNCNDWAGADENIVRSEIFGRVPGFLGPKDPGCPGVIKQADAGTLFLDEIGRLPMYAQGSLLIFLEKGEYTPLGGKLQKSDIRFICASNTNLSEGVKAGKFSLDLFHRVNGPHPIVIFPLRKRQEDIPLLVRHFVESHCADLKRSVPEIDPAVMEGFCNYAWPGNVRQLDLFIKHVIDYGFVKDRMSENVLELLSKEEIDQNYSHPYGPLVKQYTSERLSAATRFLDEMEEVCLIYAEKKKISKTDIAKELKVTSNAITTRFTGYGKEMSALIGQFPNTWQLIKSKVEWDDKGSNMQ